jgi:hypothetical protein
MPILAVSPHPLAIRSLTKVSFGTASNVAAFVTIANGTGTGTGGRFDSVSFVNATGLEGTAAGDTFVVGGNVIPTIAGGLGQDHLNFTGAGLLLDNTSMVDVSGIEFMDISGSGTNTLSLTAQDIVNIGDVANIDVSHSVNLAVDADPNSTVSAQDADNVILHGGWSLAASDIIGSNGTHYDIYSSTDILASVAVDHDAHITFTA